jgi:hypothetical protein
MAGLNQRGWGVAKVIALRQRRLNPGAPVDRQLLKV